MVMIHMARTCAFQLVLLHQNTLGSKMGAPAPHTHTTHNQEQKQYLICVPPWKRILQIFHAFHKVKLTSKGCLD